MRCAAIGFGIAWMAFAQSGPLRVRGTVQVSGVNQAIPGARVVVYLGSQESAATVTDVNGAFRLSLDTPGSYAIAAEAVGRYIAGPEARQTFSVDASHPTVTRNLALGAPSAISGRLVDAETAAPIAGIGVQARAILYRFGHRLLIRSGSLATTGLDGGFRIEGLTGGDYFLELTPLGPTERETIVAGDVKEAADLPRKPAYRRQWWPGGDNSPQGLPLALRPGGEFDLGNLPLPQQPLYRVTSSVGPPTCRVSDDYFVEVSHADGSDYAAGASGHVPCGKFTVINMSPGEYRLTASGPGGPTRQLVAVQSKDLETPLTPGPERMTISGKIRLPENFPCCVMPLLLKRDTDEHPQGSFGAQRGGFQATLDFEPVRIGLSGLPSSYYVSEILYNSESVNGRFAEITPGTVSQSVQFTVSDKAASVQGKVTLEDAPVAATVLLIPWPIDPRVEFPAFFDGEADDTGVFSIAGLPPGSYRALAVTESAWNRELQRPGVLAAFAAGAKEIRLDPAASQDVALQLSDAAPQ
ncbi:MAG TPA: carboxypeptidase-like regulatory domain-containing protein [Bryobacteraceae bacterium]